MQNPWNFYDAVDTQTTTNVKEWSGERSYSQEHGKWGQEQTQISLLCVGFIGFHDSSNDTSNNICYTRVYIYMI